MTAKDHEPTVEEVRELLVRLEKSCQQIPLMAVDKKLVAALCRAYLAAQDAEDERPAPIRRFIPRQGETPRILSMSEFNELGGCKYNTCQQIELTARPVGEAEGCGS